MSADNNYKKIMEKVREMINHDNYGEAINYLEKIRDENENIEEVKSLIEQLRKIVEYRNRDIFGSTNLDMDPWLD